MKKMMMALGCANLKRRGADKNGEWNFATGNECLLVGCGLAAKNAKDAKI